MRAACVPTAFAAIVLPALTAQPLTVRVYAYAPAPGAAVRSGEEIFRRAGVDTRWNTCAPARGDCGELREGELLVKVVPRGWKGGPHRSAFGVAVVDNYSYLAWVFFDRVEDAARARAASTGMLLGRVMAHEVAHLLGLGHTGRGIMRAAFGDGEIESAETGGLEFTDAEAVELRDAVIRRRNRPSGSPTVRARLEP